MTAPGIDSCSLAPLYFEAFFGASTGRCNGFLRLCPKVLSNREPLSKHLFATSLGCRGGMTGSCSHKDRQARYPGAFKVGAARSMVVCAVDMFRRMMGFAREAFQCGARILPTVIATGTLLDGMA